MSKYLDKFGLEHYHDLIKEGLIEYIEGTQTEETSTWTGVSTSPALFKGKFIIYHLPYTGLEDLPTLNLSLPDGTATGAKNVSTEAGSDYAADSLIALVYTGIYWKSLFSIGGGGEGVVYSNSNPAMDGTASSGSSDTAARGDHVHPSDTSRAPVASPAFTGTPTAPTASSGTNTTQLATTAFVKTAVDEKVTYGDTDLTAGTSSLSTGKFYAYYE